MSSDSGRHSRLKICYPRTERCRVHRTLWAASPVLVIVHVPVPVPVPVVYHSAVRVLLRHATAAVNISARAGPPVVSTGRAARRPCPVREYSGNIKFAYMISTCKHDGIRWPSPRGAGPAKRCTKQLPELISYPCSERLSRLNLLSFELRRLHIRLDLVL